MAPEAIYPCEADLTTNLASNMPSPGRMAAWKSAKVNFWWSNYRIGGGWNHIYIYIYIYNIYIKLYIYIYLIYIYDINVWSFWWITPPPPKKKQNKLFGLVIHEVPLFLQKEHLKKRHLFGQFIVTSHDLGPKRNPHTSEKSRMVNIIIWPVSKKIWWIYVRLPEGKKQSSSFMFDC